MNDEIRAQSVRVIGPDGTQFGILSLGAALSEAEKASLDLVEVAPDSTPPVCRIMDYGKYRYQQSKKVHSAKKSQVIIQIKEIRLRPKTESHDFETKMKHVRRFLEQNNKVKVNMLFRGREIVYADLGRKLMEQVRAQVEELGQVEQEPKLEGRHMTMVIAPKKV
ncbi:MAG TPA: translation initiation factor IF-3 [Syntrophales bacterium]|nr:translation initiation factor IF-3 [Syntrophales bacterium]